jgi:peptide/nickel transport system ATP-binding protein
MSEPTLDQAGVGGTGDRQTAASQGGHGAPGPSQPPLLSIKGLRAYFPYGGSFDRLFAGERGAVRAVDGVDIDIGRGEVVGLVGESGSGKTTLGRAIAGLMDVAGGQILYDGRDLTRMSSRRWRRLRRKVQIIFQDPYSSLSPRLRVEHLLLEPYTIHKVPSDQRYSVSELLGMVDLAFELRRKYPHELSGGQARRVGIARALALRPEFIVADEITSGLDVSAGSSVLNLMEGLRDQLGLTYLFITHNLNLVGYVAQRIAVMYLGQLIEVGTTDQVFDSPAHPYTRALLASISEPNPSQRRAESVLISGEIPSPRNPPSGCRFHPRCPFAGELSSRQQPLLQEIASRHFVACHYWDRIPADSSHSLREV